MLIAGVGAKPNEMGPRVTTFYIRLSILWVLSAGFYENSITESNITTERSFHSYVLLIY